MKIKYLFLIIIAVFTNSCSDDLDRSGTYKPDKGITATIPSYPFDDGTRVNISEDLQTFTWSDEDKFGVYYDGADIQTGIWYTIKQGGSSTGNFSNEVFYLNPTRDYYAFYPFSSTATTLSARIDFTGQVQSGNGSTAHLGAYNYMYGKININTDGGASVPFYNLGSIMQLQLTVSNSVTYTSIDITSDLAKFTTKGVARMTYGGITATEISDSIHFDFKGGLTLNAGDVLIANILIAPVDMSGSTLTFTLTDEYNNTYKVNTAGKNMLQGKAYRYSETVPYKKIEKIPYITFTADAEQTFQMSRSVSTLEYSLNNGNWAELGTTQVTFGGANGVLRLRGKASGGTGGSTISFGNATKVACSGDIRTLMDYESYETITSSGYFSDLFLLCTQLTSAPNLPATELANVCYLNMFYGCTSLTQAPQLPATNLTIQCYRGMFHGCTSLTQAPELPATTLASGCYCEMFKECTSLTQAPELPATNLADYCYNFMFSGCTSLTQAPELPATTLTSYCYAGMFNGCKSLTQAPELPATNLADNCYLEMFRECTSLTQAPELPATNLADNCYNSMFSGCTSLTQALELSATNLAPYCYSEMFDYCTSLTQAPELPATNLAPYCYSKMFYYCTSLTQAPELPATNLDDNCYNSMFYRCTSLAQAPSILPASNLADSCYLEMFRECTSLTQAPELPATNLADYCYNSMFYDCTSLTQAPELPATNLAQYCYQRMFYRCTSLTQAPLILPATKLASSCYYSMFYGCENMKTPPQLPATTLASSCYAAMFNGCISLTQAPELPATNLAENCYNSMFYRCTSLANAPSILPATTLTKGCYRRVFGDCTSLTQAPELPAANLADYCYGNMFNGCNNLNYIKMMAIDISASSCLSYWVWQVSSTGTFVKNKDATWNVTGESGIPSGWTVVTE